MARLIRRDLHANSPMGGYQRASVHDKARPTGRNAIFPTGSPVHHGQRRQPRLLRRKMAKRKVSSLKDRISPLMEAREQANSVYTDHRNYFENHYPDADRDLKTALDEKVMTAHSRLNAEDGEDGEEGTQGITIVLNVGK